MNATREHEVLGLQPRLLDPLLHSLAGRLRDLELHRALRLVLHHHGAGCNLVAVADVPDLETDKVTTAQLAVDSQVEESKLAHPALHLEADSKCPDILEFERRLLDVEHDAAKVTIAELRSTHPDDRFYDAKMKVLSEQIKHHVHEEELRSEGMFAQARAAGVDVDALGERMTARKKSLLVEYKENGLPVATTRSFAGHELKRGEPLEEAASAE